MMCVSSKTVELHVVQVIACRAPLRLCACLRTWHLRRRGVVAVQAGFFW